MIRLLAIPIFACLTGTALAAPQHQVPQPKTFEEAEPLYRERLGRPTVWKRIEGRRFVAQTKDPRGLALLAKSYKKPEQPREIVRALCVHLGLEFFDESKHAGAWAAWRNEFAKPDHAWLWFAALGVEAKANPSSWTEVVNSRLPAVLRAAAITAGTRISKNLPDQAALDLFSQVLEKPNAFGLEHELLLESILANFDRPKDRGIGSAHRSMLRALSFEMGDKRRSARSKLIMSRMFARILKRQNIGPYPEVWNALLADDVPDSVNVDFARRAAAQVPGFFGIPDHSQNVVYVIDASDSMLVPLTPTELGELTGVEEKPSEAERASRALANSIDWSKVKCRFDAARELLVSSIRRLRPDQRFAIVLFGDEAIPLSTTPKLIAPTSKTLDKVEADLRAIQPGPQARNRPHGTLRGKTNLYGGIARAFELTTKRSLKKNVDIAYKSFADAADTIYVLSDGAPNWDDYHGTDSSDGEQAGDPEGGQRYKHDGDLIFYGPFGSAPYLVADVERLNLLRRASIHMIGLGEADDALLERLAEIGRGKFVKIGGK